MSRDAILKQIEQNQPEAMPMPASPQQDKKESPDRLANFVRMVETVGGRCIEAASSEDIAATLRCEYDDRAMIVSCVPAINIGSCHLETITSAAELDDLNLALISGQFGVAENGAIWVSEQNMTKRILPFITAHLAIVLDRRALVDDMHQAYARLQDNDSAYGVFIAGPSKTADIEQCLVIGAHGPLSLTVFLL